MAVQRVLFDTSVLIPAMIASHANHAIAVRWLGSAIARELRLVLAAHSLAECYATLTRLPVPHRVEADRALALIRGNLLDRARAVIVALSAEDYVQVIDDIAGRRIEGGAVYDALIVHAATKARARILTFNTKDFRRLCKNPEKDLLAP
jgi:predicted nucleic acid-binding protein